MRIAVWATFAAMPEEEKAAMRDRMPEADKRMAAMLVKRDSFNLADSLAPLLGAGLAKYIFGLGVVAMTLNAATMLMPIGKLGSCHVFVINTTHPEINATIPEVYVESIARVA